MAAGDRIEPIDVGVIDLLSAWPGYREPRPPAFLAAGRRALLGVFPIATARSLADVAPAVCDRRMRVLRRCRPFTTAQAVSFESLVDEADVFVQRPAMDIHLARDARDQLVDTLDMQSAAEERSGSR
jgi:hypothetical protein